MGSVSDLGGQARPLSGHGGSRRTGRFPYEHPDADGL